MILPAYLDELCNTSQTESGAVLTGTDCAHKIVGRDNIVDMNIVEYFIYILIVHTGLLYTLYCLHSHHHC